MCKWAPAARANTCLPAYLPTHLPSTQGMGEGGIYLRVGWGGFIWGFSCPLWPFALAAWAVYLRKHVRTKRDFAIMLIAHVSDLYLCELQITGSYWACFLGALAPWT